MSFTVKVDSREVIKALEDLEPKAANKAVQAATKKAGTFLARKVRPTVPKKTGKLRKSVTTRSAKRDRPGSYVTARAPHRHLVQQGTAERFHKSGKSVGRMTADPFISDAADKHGKEALDIAEREISKALDL